MTAQAKRPKTRRSARATGCAGESPQGSPLAISFDASLVRHERFGLLSPAGAAESIGLDRDKGMKLLRRLAESAQVSHIRFGEEIYFTAAALTESLAWLWWSSDNVGQRERMRRVAEAVEARRRGIDAQMCSADPGVRARVALWNQGESQHHYVRTLDVLQATAVGWSEAGREWPLEIRPMNVELLLALELWRSLSPVARKRAVARLAESRRRRGAGN